MNIPFYSFESIHEPIKDELKDAFSKILDNGYFILGESLRTFEYSYAAFNNVKYCIGVSNGLDALFLSLKALNIGPGDEVIVPANTYIATFLAVSYVGAKPVPVEPDVASYNLNPKLIEQAITSRTKAVIPVHLYGQACEMEPIVELAKKYGLKIIEDNAQSQGAYYSGRMTGSFGDCNATSFYPGKNLGALGDAGAITTNNQDLFEKISLLRNYGSSRKYFHELLGYNMRLDELQAAILKIKLPLLSSWIKQKESIALKYNERLCGVGDLVLPYVIPLSTHVYHQYVIRTKFRDALKEYLEKLGVLTLVHYPIPPHLQDAYLDLKYKVGSFPITEDLAKTNLSLPIWPGMTDEMVDYISTSIKLFFNTKS